MASPLSPHGKAVATTSLSAAAPSPPDDHPDAPPPPPALHLAAQQGDVARIFALLDQPALDQRVPLTASDPDAQGITALHWAAINGNTLCAQALLDRGALVDARGGDLDGTPAMWAARNGHLALVHLLVRHGADPSLADAQGFTLLHLAVHSSSAFLVAYLVYALVARDIDHPDPDGHSPLAWAAYQGDAITVELLLAAGADPARTDHAGLTALHWAVTKGNATCIRRIAASPRADLHARNADGKTAREMALALKSYAAYARALADAGLDESGARVDRPLGERNTRRAIFAVVAAALGLAFALGAHAPWYVALLAVPATAFGMHHVVVRVLLGAGNVPATPGAKGHAHGGTGERITKSPYLCAIITASLGWVAWVWLSRFITLHGYAAANAVFGVLLAACAYSFFRAVTLDPGTVRGPAPGSEGLKAVIEELVEAGSFNGMSFCLSCLVRRPLRSKHSYATERCVARFDHYCPWVWNDVGVNNHREFLVFLTTLVLGVSAFVRLTYIYFYERAPDLAPSASCPALMPTLLCMSALYDPFVLLVSLWSALQLTWVTILLGAQTYQVARQRTTLEQSNLGRYGYMGGRAGVSAQGAGQMGAVEKWEAARRAREAQAAGEPDAAEGAEDEASLAHAPARSDSPAPPGAPRARGRMGLLLRLLGLDRFLLRPTPSSLPRPQPSTTPSSTANPNPFELSPLQNCTDFWTRGRTLGVAYDALYAVPEGGFARAVAERRARERARRRGERGGGGGRRAAGGAQGYERVALDNV